MISFAVQALGSIRATTDAASAHTFIKHLITVGVSGPPWPAASSDPSGCQRMLSGWKFTSMSSLTTGVCPRDIFRIFLAGQWLTYSHRPSGDASMPFGPLPSLPGMIENPLFGLHSQISPVLVGSLPGWAL